MKKYLSIITLLIMILGCNREHDYKIIITHEIYSGGSIYDKSKLIEFYNQDSIIIKSEDFRWNKKENKYYLYKTIEYKYSDSLEIEIETSNDRFIGEFKAVNKSFLKNGRVYETRRYVDEICQTLTKYSYSGNELESESFFVFSDSSYFDDNLNFIPVIDSTLRYNIQYFFDSYGNDTLIQTYQTYDSSYYYEKMFYEKNKIIRRDFYKKGSDKIKFELYQRNINGRLDSLIIKNPIEGVLLVDLLEGRNPRTHTIEIWKYVYDKLGRRKEIVKLDKGNIEERYIIKYK